MPKDKKMWDNILTVIMSLLCLLWIYPIVLILQNSLKTEGTFSQNRVENQIIASCQTAQDEILVNDESAYHLNNACL